jgi:hypothetical protein
MSIQTYTTLGIEKSYPCRKITQNTLLYSLSSIAVKVAGQEAVSFEIKVPLNCIYCFWDSFRQKGWYPREAPTTLKSNKYHCLYKEIH